MKWNIPIHMGEVEDQLKSSKDWPIEVFILSENPTSLVMNEDLKSAFSLCVVSFSRSTVKVVVEKPILGEV